jgi:subtilisin family serine protease
MRRRFLGLRALAGVAFVATLLAGPAAAQMDDHSDHGGGHIGGGGLGIGLGIGIGTTILQQGIAPHPDNNGSPDLKRKATIKSKAVTRAPTSPNGGGTAGGNSGSSGVPPRGEQRFVAGEVITEFSAGVSQQTIDQVARRYNLTQLETQNLPLIGSTLYLWRVGGRRSVADVIGSLESERGVAAAQPNYIFALQEEIAPAGVTSAGDPAQYVLEKLQIHEAHQLATGKNILVAVIDSQIDAGHPDVANSIAKSFDAVGGELHPHKHGTAMAGAIAAHGKLLGIAPGVNILAAHAFDDGAEAKGTSFAIYKSLQWSTDNNARIVNMSFAGPYDPAMHRLLAALNAKDVVLIAAAGNAGPKAPPLYPGADAVVIAVTATDSNDAVFKMANRGDYVAVAAPGVDILADAPDGSFQTTTGTSVAAAHVSGIAALLLEQQTTLKPSDVRSILTTAAKPLAAGKRPDFGAGLVNAYRVVTQPAGRSAGTGDGVPQSKK